MCILFWNVHNLYAARELQASWVTHKEGATNILGYIPEMFVTI
jgi:hypothetical protein